MMKYRLIESSRYPFELDAKTLVQARQEMLDRARVSLQRCRSATRCGYLHKRSEDCYVITLGSDPHSALWEVITLVKF